MHVAPARKEKARVYFLPHTRLVSVLNKDFFFMMTSPAVFFVSFPSTKYPKTNGKYEKLSIIFGI